MRLGKGFTLEELKEAKIPKKLAYTIGIAVDHRRKNRCMESLQVNVERLKLYKSKLLIFPNKHGKKGVKAGDTPRSELQNVAQNTLKAIIPIPKPDDTVEVRAITSEEKEHSAYKALRKARQNQKFLGARLKKEKAKTEES
uniref:60S ribosomal protein L13 n=1 Tax=Alexandrium catenella TaxID=2925 RepID=A0A7S1WLA5_ALECA